MHNNLAEVYRFQGDHKRALPRYLRALALVEQLGPQTPMLAVVKGNLGLLYLKQDDLTKAEPLLLEALAIREKAYAAQHPEIVLALDNLAELYQAKGNSEQSLVYATRAQEMREALLRLMLASGSERGKQLFLNTLAGQTNGLVSLYLQTARDNATAARLAVTAILRQKGRALDAATDQFALLRRNATPEDLALLKRLVDTRARLAELLLGVDSSLTPAARDEEVNRLTVEDEALQNAISRRHPELQANSQAITLDHVLRALPPDAALLEFFIYHPFQRKAVDTKDQFGEPLYLACVVRRDAATPRCVELGAAETLDGAVMGLRGALRKPRSADYTSRARGVYELLMTPLLKHLGGVRRLIIAPDGELNLLPFAALVDKQGRFLVENYALSYLTSGRDLLRLQTTGESQTGPVIVADPSFELSTTDRPPADNHGKTLPAAPGQQPPIDFGARNYEPLPGTAAEAYEIARRLPGAHRACGPRRDRGCRKRRQATTSVTHRHARSLPSKLNARYRRDSQRLSHVAIRLSIGGGKESGQRAG